MVLVQGFGGTIVLQEFYKGLDALVGVLVCSVGFSELTLEFRALRPP